MNRKDIIIISVLINAAMLAVLFITATHTDEDVAPKQDIMRTAMNDPQPVREQPETSYNQPEMEPYLTDSQQPLDEVDHAIRDYVPDEALPLESPQVSATLPDPEMEEVKHTPASTGPQHFVEVTVKKGDMLEKIAKSNGTTVQAIKDANKLTTDKLKIGQVLKIPTGSTSSTSTKSVETSKPIAAATPVTAASTDPVYYTIKSGDNPWKIAKQFGVKFDDILRLNNMTEEQARKMKVGDKVRVK